ncbi:Putative Chromatin remodeling complex subunit [[Torrubiella] hemipterigena]|uniref:Putative Chromatin remodeling complex subunit n=1 Tax=[Torrubiella] hemipterigena TaxID=1531966 RepID=A0A0A1TAZ1_9HYPO|nr:Putative Chromatin remodeling complex subunit [[Torrubiella] hemipterigena]
MSSVGRWREEQILIVCPGSKTTLAQIGCSELTLPTHRLPTRMFKDGDEWRPYHTYLRKKVVGGVEQEEWVEDVDSDEGAVYPIKGGHIVEMEAFLAFLDHVHGLLTTTYHNTPIMLMASPQWTRPDCETIARYIFEKTRTPALCLLHSALATQYGLKWPSMTVVDIGYEKVDVTAIHDGRVVNHMDVGASEDGEQISGGEAFTQRLMQLLKAKTFNHDMAEQLKHSNICEVLPYAANAENLVELPIEVTQGAPASGANSAPAADTVMQDASKISASSAALDNGGTETPAEKEDDGVLDVAAIVTSGQTKEFLAKKEQEKAQQKEKGKPGRKPKVQEEAAPARPVRLPNSKRTHNTFFYEEIIQEEVPPEPKEKHVPAEPVNGAAEVSQTQPEATTEPAQASTEDSVMQTGDAPAPAEGTNAESGAQDSTTAPKEEVKEEVKEEPKEEHTPEYRAKRVRRDIEVGLERFTFADRHEIDRIVSAIYKTVQGVDDMYMRPACWDNLVFVGNGSRLRGLKDNILQTLNARHLISPSTATMFTSELPSNMATPSGTGSQTPVGAFNGVPHQLSASGVNPLLQAATTANTFGAGVLATPQAGSDAAGPTGHHFHSQTPTSIKTVTIPSYLSEWSKHGFEESMFLGAQVAARIAFCLHSNLDAQAIEAQRQMSLSRVDYNELGPKGIRSHSMLG